MSQLKGRAEMRPSYWMGKGSMDVGRRQRQMHATGLGMESSKGRVGDDPNVQPDLHDESPEAATARRSQAPY